METKETRTATTKGKAKVKKMATGRERGRNE